MYSKFVQWSLLASALKVHATVTNVLALGVQILLDVVVELAAEEVDAK